MATRRIQAYCVKIVSVSRWHLEGPGMTITISLFPLLAAIIIGVFTGIELRQKRLVLWSFITRQDMPLWYWTEIIIGSILTAVLLFQSIGYGT